MTEQRPSPWHSAKIVSLTAVTPTVRSVVLATRMMRFRAGQYLDVRLTAPDGYQAQRSYSIASLPSAAPLVEVMIERLDEGEISSFFHDIAEPGDAIEVRGPIGLPFTWAPEDGGPLLLAGGGAGVVPLLSMLRSRAAQDVGARCPAVLLYAADRRASVIAASELEAAAATDPRFHLLLHLTREPDGVARPGRIESDDVADALRLLGSGPPRCFLCGSNNFVTHLAALLVDAGVPSGRVRTERFG